MVGGAVGTDTQRIIDRPLYKAHWQIDGNLQLSSFNFRSSDVLNALVIPWVTSVPVQA